MAKDKAPGGPAPAGKLRQIRNAYTLTKRNDKRIGWVLLGTFLATWALMIAIGFLVDSPWILAFLGFMTAILVMTIVFGRRAERSAFAQIEGQVGAAASAMSTLKRNWIVTPGVNANRDLAIIHRAVGRPGIVLVGEGPPARVAPLLAQEKKKYGRVVPEIPVYDVQAGSEEGQIPLRKLTRHLMKLPRNITPGQVSEVDKRLKAIGSLNLPIPKGPLPKGIKMPRAPRGR